MWDFIRKNCCLTATLSQAQKRWNSSIEAIGRHLPVSFSRFLKTVGHVYANAPCCAQIHRTCTSNGRNGGLADMQSFILLHRWGLLSDQFLHHCWLLFLGLSYSVKLLFQMSTCKRTRVLGGRNRELADIQSFILLHRWGLLSDWFLHHCWLFFLGLSCGVEPLFHMSAMAGLMPVKTSAGLGIHFCKALAVDNLEH